MATKLYEAKKKMIDVENKAMRNITHREPTNLTEIIAIEAAATFHSIKIDELMIEYYDLACINKEAIAKELEERKERNAQMNSDFFGETTEEAVVNFFKEQKENYKQIKRKRQIEFDTLMNIIDRDETAKREYKRLLYKDEEYWAFINSLS